MRFLIAFIFLFFLHFNEAFAIQNYIDDNLSVPPDELIVEVSVNEMPRNLTIGYDLNYDGVADIFFMFPIYEDYSSENFKLSEVNCAVIENNIRTIEKVCRYKVESKLWVLLIEDHYVYRINKEWSGYYQAVSKNKIETVEKTYKDVGKKPDEYYYDKDLMED